MDCVKSFVGEKGTCDGGCLGVWGIDDHDGAGVILHGIRLRNPECKALLIHGLPRSGDVCDCLRDLRWCDCIGDNARCGFNENHRSASTARTGGVL